jgi:hypothetical protein
MTALGRYDERLGVGLVARVSALPSKVSMPFSIGCALRLVQSAVELNQTKLGVRSKGAKSAGIHYHALGEHPLPCFTLSLTAILAVG